MSGCRSVSATAHCTNLVFSAERECRQEKDEPPGREEETAEMKPGKSVTGN